MSVEVSFIIIEYHSLTDVLNCVKTIKQKCLDISFEIIISSNSTYEEEKQESLKIAHPKIKWCFNPKNNGFAYGMNCGISIANGEFIILQNPDTSLQNDRLEDVLKLMKQDKTIGLVGPQILNGDGKIQDSTRKFMTPSIFIYRILSRIIFKKRSILDKTFNYNAIQKVNWIIGAYMITTKDALNKVGHLNEKFFMYVEDMDLCLRFWECNYKVIYYPLLIVKYEGDRKSTTGPLIGGNKYRMMHFKNYFYFLNRHGLKKISRLATLSN